MELTLQQAPLEAVAAQISTKTPVGAALSSEAWAQMPVQLREDAFFAARLESARALAFAQAGLEKLVRMARDPNGALSMNRGKWIEEMQSMANALGLRPADPGARGGLTDLGSERRLQLIYEQQIGQAQGKAYYLSGQDPDILDAWPAQKLVRIKEPRGGLAARRDWPARWVAAGGKLLGGRMVALKTDPIWTKISRFGRPWPPFDFSSGMGLEEQDRETAEALGLIKPGEKIAPSVEREEAARKASVKGLPPALRRAMREVFGDQIVVEGDEVRWRDGAKAPPLGSPANRRALPPAAQPKPGRGLAAEPERPTVEESAHINSAVEIATIYSRDGAAVETIKGNKTSVDLGKARVERGDFRDTTVSHNHPAGNSFSMDDVGLAASAGLGELRIVAKRKGGGSRLYRLVRPAGGWPPGSAYVAAYADASRATESRLKALGQSSTQRRATHAHETMLEMARILGREYVDYRVIDLS